MIFCNSFSFFIQFFLKSLLNNLKTFFKLSMFFVLISFSNSFHLFFKLVKKINSKGIWSCWKKEAWSSWKKVRIRERSGSWSPLWAARQWEGRPPCGIRPRRPLPRGWERRNGNPCSRTWGSLEPCWRSEKNFRRSVQLHLIKEIYLCLWVQIHPKQRRCFHGY